MHNVPLFKNIVVDTSKIEESFGSVVPAVEVIEAMAFDYDLDIIRPTVRAPPPPSNQPFFTYTFYQWKFVSGFGAEYQTSVVPVVLHNGFHRNIRPAMHIQGIANIVIQRGHVMRKAT